MIKSLLLILALVPAVPAWAADESRYAPVHLQGTDRVVSHFLALYEEFGARVRITEMLLRCGHKKESDELNASTRILAKKKLVDLIDKDLKDKALQSVAAANIAHEGTLIMLAGYVFGYRESLLALTSDFSIPAATYKSLCELSINKAREWREEDK